MATANTYLQVSELDFDEIRTNLKSYLSTQNQFADYNFEGSAMAVLLDVLAYNTHYNAYYLNMVANEMFLDTAQQRDSVVSRSKELGYIPVSSIGATAVVNLVFNGVANTINQFTIPAASKFSTTIDDITYSYVTTGATKVINNANTYSTNVTLKEGNYLTHAFTVDSSNPIRYILPNKDIDTSSITVNVQGSVSDTTKSEYTRLSNIREIFSTSTIYSIEESADEKYEIIFGDGVLGKPVKSGNIVIVSYLVNNGEDTNGADTFSIDTLNVGVVYSSASISTVTKASGGRPKESIESIKYNAPRNYQTQNRAVIDNDYQRIILSENSDLQSVIAFGGEQATPPVYGKVYIAVKPFDERFATNARKIQIKEGISDRVPLAIDPVIIDADYTYVIPTIKTYYDLTSTTETSTAIEQKIRDVVTSFSTNNLERFGNRLRFSRFVRELDNTANGYILNNDVSIKLEKRFVPDFGKKQTISLDYNNAIRKGTLDSTEFTYKGFSSYLDDDGVGNINAYRFNDAKEKVNISSNIGTINYDTGAVLIIGLSPTAVSDLELKVSVVPERLDVVPVREQILLMESGDANITTIGENT
jgi:hypothetical protein